MLNLTFDDFVQPALNPNMYNRHLDVNPNKN